MYVSTHNRARLGQDVSSDWGLGPTTALPVNLQTLTSSSVSLTLSPLTLIGGSLLALSWIIGVGKKAGRKTIATAKGVKKGVKSGLSA